MEVTHWTLSYTKNWIDMHDTKQFWTIYTAGTYKRKLDYTGDDIYILVYGQCTAKHPSAHTIYKRVRPGEMNY